MSVLRPDGTKQLILSRDQFRDINTVLDEVFVGIKRGAAMLAHISGMLVSQKGSMDTNNLSLLTTLAAADYVATKEMARLIGESNGFERQFHEGKKNNIYVTAVGDEFLMTVIFSESTTYGMVRVLASKAATELTEILSRKAQANSSVGLQALPTTGTSSGTDFQNELSSRLASVLATNK